MVVMASPASATAPNGSESKGTTLWNADPYALVRELLAAGRQRAFLLTDASGRLIPSHPSLEPLARALAQESSDYRQHQALFFEVGRESAHLFGAFVHQTHRGQGAGGARFWTYDRLGDFIDDGMRLALGMGQKNALAGLWWGGGKAVIARRPDVNAHDPAVRNAIYTDFGRFIAGLRGVYITAEDVGTTPEDMERIHAATRYVTCVPPGIGGSGNPSVLTARGVVVGMEAALEFLNLGTLEGKTIAMQGLGNVASYMIGYLLEHRVARIIGTDIDAGRLAAIRQRYPEAPLDLRIVDRDDVSVLAEPCNIVAPNAVGGVLNPRTIPTLKAPIVCGAANNQLAVSDRDGQALKKRGILYAPDFLVNRMGIVNCANEQYGAFENDPAVTRHLERETSFGIFQRALEVFKRAEASGRSTAEEAENLADELALEKHPLWPERGQQIIDHLVKTGWERQPA